MECNECGKELFLSLMLARNAAILYNWIFDKEFDPYECPIRSGDYHLSAMRWRFQKFAEASRSTVTGQERS